MTRHCHKCGWEWALAPQPGRSDSCHGCGSDLKVCLNCTHYDAHVAHKCRERRADPVLDKEMANFCEYFELSRRAFKGVGKNAREEAARDALKKLFGD